MKRTPVAVAVAAVFLLSAAGALGQTAGPPGSSATSSATTPAPSGSSNAPPSKAGAAAMAPGTRDKASMKGGDTRTTSLARGDRKFLETAALDGMKEVEVGKTVAGKASDAAVKAFAERMVKDHSDANKKLMDVAQSKGMTPPTAMRRSDQREVDKMAKMDAAKLDKAYMDDMVKDHKKDVKAFEKEAKGAKDAEVKKFAADTLPTLQEHLKMAQDTQSKLKGGGSPATRSGAAAGTSAMAAPATPGTSAAGSPAPAPGATTPAGMGKDAAKK